MTSAAVVAEGLYFGEGPRWHEDRLWFTAPTAMTEISAASRQGRIVSARVETAGAGWP